MKTFLNNDSINETLIKIDLVLQKVASSYYFLQNTTHETAPNM